ncbi:MAG: hypothetical protein JWP75_2720, partial [Frondihabitans sp.]|nr:hypothetical protein [Frondihabitans sp.]
MDGPHKGTCLQSAGCDGPRWLFTPARPAREEFAVMHLLCNIGLA